MVRLTAELILASPQFINPLKERELDLRGNKINTIENLGCTENQFDAIDFSDNDVSKVEGFPLLPRLKTLLVNNNKVSNINVNMQNNTPNLENLILTNNRIESLLEVDNLVGLKKLHTISFLKNPITKQPNYRKYIIFKLPWLKVLDFSKVKIQEVKEAKTYFGQAGNLPKQNQEKAKTFEPGQSVHDNRGLTPDEKQKIKIALANASSMEETNQLERILQSGKMPKDFDVKYGLNKRNNEVEGMETEENQTENKDQGMDEEYDINDV